VWKNPQNFFHCVEKTAKVFPLCGKIAESFSIAWKKWACFSTVWKIFFHSVEKSRKSFPYCGKLDGLRGLSAGIRGQALLDSKLF
jgi:hypothetical protein